MKFVTTSIPNLTLTEETFPRTLRGALLLIRNAEFPEYQETSSIAFTESIDFDFNGDNHSEEIDISLWEFRRIDGQWTPTEIPQEATVETADLPLLVHAFSAMASAIYKRGIRRIHIYNSREFSTVFYGFDWPFDYSDNLAVADVPVEILDACKEAAKNIGYSFETYANM